MLLRLAVALKHRGGSWEELVLGRTTAFVLLRSLMSQSSTWGSVTSSIDDLSSFVNYLSKDLIAGVLRVRSDAAERVRIGLAADLEAGRVYVEVALHRTVTGIRVLLVTALRCIVVVGVVVGLLMLALVRL